MIRLKGIKRLTVIEAFIKQDEDVLWDNIDHISDLYQHFTNGAQRAARNNITTLIYDLNDIKIAESTIKWLDTMIAKMPEELQLTLILHGCTQ